MKIEYLIIVEDSSSFCSDKKSFLKLLEVDSRFNISENTVTYNNDYNLGFDLNFSKKDKIIQFELKLIFENIAEDKIITEITRILKTNILKINPNKTSIRILWDDLGIKYSMEAYPLVNSIENLMRKLISKFMITNVGLSWTENRIHKETQKKTVKRKGGSDFYYDEIFFMDFMDLSDILFKKYRILKEEDIDKIIIDSVDVIKREELIEFVAKSNWERHFAEIINKEGSRLEKIWSELSLIRNEIAHNRFIDFDKLNQLKSIKNELEPILLKAIESLESIQLTVDEKKETKNSYLTKSNLIRLSKVARLLNVGISTLVELMNRNGFNVESNPNTKLNSSQLSFLENEFGVDLSDSINYNVSIGSQIESMNRIGEMVIKANQKKK